MKKKRFLVEYVGSGYSTIESIQKYLDKYPHPDYNLVNCQLMDGTFLVVWQLK